MRCFHFGAVFIFTVCAMPRAASGRIAEKQSMTFCAFINMIIIINNSIIVVVVSTDSSFFHTFSSDLLGIQPSANNGTEGSLDHLLWRTFNRTRQAAAQYDHQTSTNVSQPNPCNCALGASQVGVRVASVMAAVMTSRHGQDIVLFVVCCLLSIPATC